MAEWDREYAAFVEAAGAALRRTAFLVCGDWPRADDVVQEALYKLYLRWAKVDRSGKPLGYARRMVDGFTGSGHQVGCRTHRPCAGWMYRDQGRVDSSIARLRIEPVHGSATHDVEVRDGWFAIAWLNNDPQARGDAKVTAYDRNGKVLKTVMI